MENSKIAIKQATVKDAVSIALLGRITFTEAFGGLFSEKNDLLNYLERTFSVQKIKEGIQKENNVFFIAFLDELPVGYGKLKLHSESEFLEDENLCQLQKIYVLQDFLSLGIGKELHNTLLKIAIDKKYDSIWLSVLESNQRAIDFYLKIDYQSVGMHKYTIGREDFEFYVMHKKLKQ